MESLRRTPLTKCYQCFINITKNPYQHQLMTNHTRLLIKNYSDDVSSEQSSQSIIKKSKSRLKSRKPTTSSTKQKVVIMWATKLFC